MSHIRPEELDMGVFFEVAALGTVSLGQIANIDLIALQKPLRELYVACHKTTGTQPLPHCRLVVSNKGLTVTEAPASSIGGPPPAETLYNIPSVTYAAAVKFVVIGKKEKDFKCAFEAIDNEPPTAPKGKNDLYVSIDKKWKHLLKVSPHSAICVCVIQRMTGVKALELHAFVCQSDDQARNIISGLTSASRNFAQRDLSPIYAQSPYDLGRPPVQPVYAQNPYDLARPVAPPNGRMETVQGGYGYQGHVDPGLQAGYRGTPEFQPPNDHTMGWNQDPRSPGGRPVQVNEGPQGSGSLAQQRDQLMRNFHEDQRRNEFMRSGPEQGIYDIQHQQPRGIYDIQHPQSPIYDSQMVKPEQPSTIYEYRPQQPNLGSSQMQEPLYGGQQSQGIYDQTRMMGGISGSADRILDDPTVRGASDGPKRQPEPQPEPEKAKMFSIPRSKISYEAGSSESGSTGKNLSPVDYEPTSLMRPPNLGYETGNRSPYMSSKVDRQPGPDQTLEKKTNKKAQPPAPAAKTKPPPATSPTTETIPRGPLSSGNHAQETQPEGSMAQARKVHGIKVFPTIMMRGAKAAALAAEDEEETNSSDQSSSRVLENLRNLDKEKQPVGQKRSLPDRTEVQSEEKSKKEREIETALGGMSIEQGRGSRSSQDFEQSLGYFP